MALVFLMFFYLCWCCLPPNRHIRLKVCLQWPWWQRRCCGHLQPLCTAWMATQKCQDKASYRALRGLGLGICWQTRSTRATFCSLFYIGHYASTCRISHNWSYLHYLNNAHDVLYATATWLSQWSGCSLLIGWYEHLLMGRCICFFFPIIIVLFWCSCWNARYYFYTESGNLRIFSIG